MHLLVGVIPGLAGVYSAMWSAAEHSFRFFDLLPLVLSLKNVQRYRIR
jgi:hypothetical protein